MSRGGETLRPVVVTLLWALGVAGVTGCAGQIPVPGAPTSGTTTSEGGSSATSASPSITREVPPEQRKRLGGLPAQQICDLISPNELEKLAFPVEAGKPRGAGDPPVGGCEFPGRPGKRSILIGSQPPGFATLGTTEVELGNIKGTQELRAGDCTVYAPVNSATLQVSVLTDEPDDETCQHAAGIAEYLLSGLIT